MSVNHHPVFKGIRLCGNKTGTAISGAAITCPHCRAVLERKAETHEATSASSKGSQARFFAADADRVRAMLAVSA